MKKLAIATAVTLATAASVAFASSVVTGGNKWEPAISISSGKENAPRVAMHTNVGGKYYNYVTLHDRWGGINNRPLNNAPNGEKAAIRFDLYSNKPGSSNGTVVINQENCSVMFYDNNGNLKGQTPPAC